MMSRSLIHQVIVLTAAFGTHCGIAGYNGVRCNVPSGRPAKTVEAASERADVT